MSPFFPAANPRKFTIAFLLIAVILIALPHIFPTVPTLVYIIILFVFFIAGFIIFLQWQKKQEQIFRHQKNEAKLFSHLIESAPHAVVLVNAQGLIVLLNAQAEQYFGYKPQEILHKPVDILWPGAFKEKFETIFKKYSKAPEKWTMESNIEFEGLTKEKRKFPIEINITSVKTEEHVLFPIAIYDITRRKEAETALKKSEQSFQLLTNTIKEYAIFLLDTDGRIASWNKGAESIKGYKAEEVIGKLTDIFYTQNQIDNHEPSTNLEKALALGHFETEGWRVRKDGLLFYADVVITALYDEAGIFYGYSKITRDITEKRKAQEELEVLKRQIELTNEGIYILNRERNITSWNHGAVLVYGYTKEEAIGKNSNELLQTDLTKKEIEDAIEDLKAKGYWRSVLKRKRKDGKEIYVRVSNTVIRNDEGEITGYVAVNIDITREVKLRAEADRLANILEYSNEAIISRDTQRNILSWNKGAEKLFGYSKEEAIGAKINELGFFKVTEEEILEIQKEILTKGSWRSEHTYYHKNGNEVFGAITGSVIKKENGEVDSFNYIIKDITERKRFEDYLKNENEELEIKVAKRTEELYNSEQKFRTLIENSNDMITLMSSSFHLFYRSPSATRITGWTDDEIINHESNHLIHPDDREITSNVFMEAHANPGKTIHSSLRYQNKAGFYMNFEGTVTNLLHDPSIKAIVFNYRDITQKINAEQKIARNERRFRSLIENSADTFTLLDKNFKILYRSASAVRITGWSNEEAESLDILEQIHPGDREYANENIQYMFQNPEIVIPFALRYQHKNGHYLHIDGTIANYLNDDDIHALVLTFRDVTEKVEAEEKVAAKEEHYRALIENSADGISLMDEQMQIFYRSPYGMKRIGEVTGDSGIMKIHPDFTTYFKNKFAESLANPGKPIAYQIKYLGTDGEFFWSEGKLTNLLHLKSVKAVVANYREITERKAAEEALVASEEKYRTLIEQASDAIFITDFTGRLLSVNASACRLSQYTEVELLNMSIYDFAIFEDLKSNPFHFEELKTGRPISTERVMKKRDGNIIHVEVSAKMILDGRLLVFVRDITERIKAQIEIIKEKNLSESIINSMPSIFFMHRKNGQFIRWNKNFETVTGYSSEEIEKMVPHDLFDEDEKDKVSAGIAEIFAAGSSKAQVEILTKNKEKIPYFVSGTVIEYEGETCLAVVALDYTERLKAQREIEETSGRLRMLTAHLQSVREEERKRIGREIHDELGQQLTAIKMDIAWIDKKTEDASPLKGSIKNVIQLLDDSNRSVRRILNELRSSILDVYGLVDALEWLGNQFVVTKNVKLVFHSPDHEIKVNDATATCLYRIYQEGLTNIAKYANAKHVDASLQVNGNNIILRVSDDGIGFDCNEVQSKIQFGILGMKERVFSLGGEFEITSLPGNGTSIYVCLPYNL